MKERRTDLAQEAKELWEESAEKSKELQGVKATEENYENFSLSRVEILNEEGEQALGKPKGLYISLSLGEDWIGEAFLQWVEVLAKELGELLKDFPEKAPVLVVGLGNEAVTPDAVGPKVQSLTAVTRHLVSQIPEHFQHLRPVSAIPAGVLGTTGVESFEIIRGITEEISPACIVAVDALASRSLDRVCRTVQLANTGITPGSGVGNHRGRLDEESLGRPVIAVGVPTVVDGATLVADLLGQETLELEGGDFFVTPKEIDSQVEKLSKLIAYGINLALNPSLTMEDIEFLVG
ncbi:MAG: GPR endopeptidase [Eubacteriales bacterium]